MTLPKNPGSGMAVRFLNPGLALNPGFLRLQPHEAGLSDLHRFLNHSNDRVLGMSALRAHEFEPGLGAADFKLLLSF